MASGKPYPKEDQLKGKGSKGKEDGGGSKRGKGPMKPPKGAPCKKGGK